MFFQCTFLVFLLATLGSAQHPAPPESDPLKQGLWWLYHIQYDKAYTAFDRHTAAHPEDPAGPFYKTAVSWWHLAQNLDEPMPEVEARMEKDYQETLRVAKALFTSSEDPKSRAWAYLYWGGAEGLKGRWLVTQKQWIKAYLLGKRGHNYLHRALKLDPHLHDAYLGLGIYDYFTDTLAGVQAALAAILIRGDKHRGMEELERAIATSDHARVEAMFFLIEIYSFEEDKPEKALTLTKILREEFPNSPVVHLAEITTLYQMKDWSGVSKESQNFLEKSEKETPWYTHHGIPPALYCLGVATLYGKKDTEGAARYFDRILSQDSQSPSRWVTFANLRKGQVLDLRHEREKAIVLYKKVLARANFWGSHKEAKEYLKSPYSFE